MTTPKQQRASQAPPSRRALRSAYELILTQIWPRLPATESTCRRINHEDQTRTKRNHH
ncbi:hypothetical protein [Brevibacillus porteri]|uniref:hypothetical protein n=1 Tax=Brevibacillus porteri TaxID=2126350 RepID=UPI003D1C2267